MFGLAVIGDPLAGQLQGRLHPSLQLASPHKLYGTTGNAYAPTIKAGTDGYTPTSVGAFNVSNGLLLIPFLLFFNLWSNWGATLYGEVRGASDFRKNIYAMGGALIFTTIVAVIFFLLFAKTFGWQLLRGLSNAFYAGAAAGRRSRIRARSRPDLPRQSACCSSSSSACSRCGSSAGWGRCSCPRPAWCSPPRSTGSCRSGSAERLRERRARTGRLG